MGRARELAAGLLSMAPGNGRCKRHDTAFCTNSSEARPSRQRMPVNLHDSSPADQSRTRRQMLVRSTRDAGDASIIPRYSPRDGGRSVSIPGGYTDRELEAMRVLGFVQRFGAGI